MQFWKTVFINISVTLLTLFVAFLVAFLFREEVFEYVGSYYIEQVEEMSSEEKRDMPSVGKGHEERVVNAVADADSAVVSVVSTQAVLSGVEQDLHPFFEDMLPDTLKEPEEEEVVGGSGFIVSSEGHIVTNRHVVEDDSIDYSVLTNSGEKYDVEVLDKDPVFDIAILKIDSEESFNYLKFGDSEDLDVGQTAIAIGNALGEFQNSVSVGVISGLSRSISAGGLRGRTEFFEEVIQTDAAINPGNSGGPLLNIKGEVVGVNTALALGSQNIGFAVPSHTVKPLVSSVKKTGRIVRAFLGVRYTEITPMLQARENLSVEKGVLLVGGGNDEPAVVPDTPADEAGLKEGDVIVSIDGEELEEPQSFARKIREKKVGETIELEVVRNEERFEIEVPLIEAPANI
ncbi:MAG: S1C family serine protease [Patescibacteria group bacterium]